MGTSRPGLCKLKAAVSLDLEFSLCLTRLHMPPPLFENASSRKQRAICIINGGRKVATRFGLNSCSLVR